MYKLLLTLVTLSSGVFCNAEQNLTDTFNLVLDRMRIIGNNESNATAEQVFHPNVLPDVLRMAMKGCVSHLQKDDYVITKGMGAHKLIQRKLNWDEARRACMAEGGQLAIINSFEEEKLLVNWMKGKDVSTAWLGVHDQFTEGDWVTLTGESLDATGYNRWTTVWPNLPDNDGGNQNCGALIAAGGMDDDYCTRKFSYFCEINVC